MDIMLAVGTDRLQVGSSDSVSITGSFEELSSDLAPGYLAGLADLLAQRGFRIACGN